MLRLALLRAPEALPEALFAAWLPLLPPERRGRLARLAPAAACRSLCGELLARQLLAQAIGRPAGAIPLAAGGNGKPYPVGLPLHISISHTWGAAACALSDRPVGVDIERPGRGSAALARRWFTPAEATWVGEDLARFCALWTQKEAACKRTGAGLSGLAQADTAVLAGSLATRWAGDLCLSVCRSPMEPFAVEVFLPAALPTP